MLLSGTVDVRENFNDERSPGCAQGLDWVLVEPRSTEADFRSALFGFDARATLKRMILEDKLGQIVDHHLPDVARQRPGATPRS